MGVACNSIIVAEMAESPYARQRAERGASAESKSGWELFLEEGPAKKDAPHVGRNREAIRDVLLDHLPPCRSDAPVERPLQVLEIASGTGQHAVYLATELKNVVWQPTDFDPVCLKSIQLWVEDSGTDSVKAPQLLDACQDASMWPVAPGSVDVILNC